MSTDPSNSTAGKFEHPQRWNRYAYANNNPLGFIDPDGRDALAVAFPDYRVATPVGRLPHLGHAGIVLINNKTGGTRYYEFGRYDDPLGRVRRVSVPNVTMGKDGLPTRDSMNKLLEAVSRQSGQGGPIEGAYFKNDKYAEMVKYAEDRMAKNSDPSRDAYGTVTNNCATFCQDTLEAGGIDTPMMIDPRPNSYIDELQGDADAIYRFKRPESK